MLETALVPDHGIPAARFPIGSEDAFGYLWAGISLQAAGDLCHPERHSAVGDEASAADCRERRSLFLHQLGFSPARLVYARQVHSRGVLWVDGERGYLDRDGDGLLILGSDPVACVTVGDCLPIFVADRRTGCFGVLHSGWRGTGILETAVGMLRERGSAPGDLAVTLGPGIGSCCYAVDGERGRLFQRRFGEKSVRRRDGRIFLDLQAANLEILSRLGVEDVAVVRSCTACTPGLSSYRRDGPSFAHMLALVGPVPRTER